MHHELSITASSHALHPSTTANQKLTSTPRAAAAPAAP